MENKINIAELLQDCPQGMELYSPIFGEVYLDRVRPHLAIVVTTDKKHGVLKEEFLYDGRYGMNGECMLFPSKDKTTWEGFQIPFKDGDILAYNTSVEPGIFIYRNKPDEHNYKTSFYVGITSSGSFLIYNKYTMVALCADHDTRLATEKEKETLLKTIKDNGYKWNAETKTLEKLVEPQFKDGDVLHIATGEGEYSLCMVDCIIGDILYTKASCSCNGHFLCTCKEQVNIEELVVMRFATEEEKEKFFKALEDNDYRWNAETNTLVKVADMKYILEAKIKEYKRLEQEIGLMVISYYEEHIKTDDGFTLKNWQIDNADNIIIIYSYINDYGKTINQVRTISCNSLIE